MGADGIDGERPSDRLATEDLVDLYRVMVTIREFEEEVQRAYLDGLVHGTTHLCQGQEAVSAGVAAALRPQDYVSITYRGHGQCIARGMSLRGMFAELFGRRTGVCKGKGGSMHMTDFDAGVIGAFGIVGAGLPVAVGAALSARIQGEDRVSVAFFGDGAANIGAFHESLNIAAVRRAPCIFVCENNLYGEFSRIDHTTPFEDLARRADAYAMPGVIVDGNDVLEVYDAAVEAVARARRGEGPTFLECKTYRHKGHSRTDPATYRSDEEVRQWLARDPVALFAKRLDEREILTRADAERIEREVGARVKEAREAAIQDPWPTRDEMFEDIFA